MSEKPKVTSPDLMTSDGHYFHPFHEKSYETEPDHGKEHPRTIIELRMSALSSTIREKPEWWVKMKDPEITAKWRAEVLEHQVEVDTPINTTLDDPMIDYVLAELEGYAALRDPETGIQPGPYERIWKSDSLIPPELQAELVDAAADLERMPQDWHPGSNGQVLDLVHPSLYPVVYGRSVRKSESGLIQVIEPPKTKSYSLSNRFQWLPSDFRISADGKVTLASPYINNAHPTRHEKLYNVIPKILERALPMFERVLSDLRQPLLPWRVPTTSQHDYINNREVDAPDCIWPDSIPYPDEENGDEFDRYEDDEDEWLANQEMDLPKIKGPYNGDLEVVKKTVSLNGTTMQCIVKLANIVLSPNNPKYPGGSWHVEGMENEHIVASYIYYYENENITTSHLSFRRATSDPMYHEQNDGFCMDMLYSIGRENPLVQEIGSIPTHNGRSIAFPNIYQHQVQPFELEDLSKSGHRKILVIFLVDPTHHIPSATDVAPQQAEFVQDAMRVAGANSLLGHLPVELLDIIGGFNDSTMTREEAEAYRLELMKERTVFVDNSSSEFFGSEFNMCEH